MSISFLIDPGVIKIEQEYHRLVELITITEQILDLKTQWAQMPSSKYSDSLYKLICSAEKDMWEARIKLRAHNLKLSSIL